MTSARLFITTAILLTAVLANAVATAAQATGYAPTYLDLIDLGTLGGNETRAYGTDGFKGARVVGASQTVDGTVHAFKYEDGVLTDLGTLGGSTSWAFAVNEAGTVTGSASLPGDVATHAFLWTEEGGMLDLGTLGGTNSRASAINDVQVSGWSQVAGDTSYHAFLWDPTNGMRDLGTLGGDNSFAYNVSYVYQGVAIACGEAETSNGARHAFVTSDGGLIDLGTLGGTYSAAISCLEPSGREIVGESSVSDDSATHAVQWNGLHSITDLGTLGGTESRALRQLGAVFGESRTVDGDLHPVRWWHGRLADFAHVLGADSRIEVVVPLFVRATIQVTNAVVSGAIAPGADVHAYIVSVPSIPTSPHIITDGVFEDIGDFSGAHFAFTTVDVTAQLDSFFVSHKCPQALPCRAGDMVSLGRNQLVTEHSGGSATVRGNEYGGVAMPQVQFTFTADYVTIPTTGEQLLTFSSRFTYSGYVRGASIFSGLYDDLFAVALRGSGTVTFQIWSCDTCIDPDGRRTYMETQLKYVFDPQ
jgi:probable HAF family extracellular repeat protein